MRRNFFITLVGTGLVGLSWVVPAAAASPVADKILKQAKQAMGGPAWDKIKTTYTRGKIATSGLTGVGESWADNLTGRYTNKFSLGPMTGADGFDGKQSWSQDTSGQPRPEEGGEARQAASNEAYRQSMAYWFSKRWSAEMEAPSEKQEGAQRFFVLRITPKGGRPFDLWIHATTYLFDHIVEKGEIETRQTFYSDYRTIDGVKVPFTVRSTNGESKYDQLTTVEQVKFNVPVNATQFGMPTPPAPDFVMAPGKTSTTVPFELINNHIYVQVKLNGQGPFRVLCDTGGANVIGPAMVQTLQLKSEGAIQGRGVGEKSEDFSLVKLHSLQVGETTVSNQLFIVMPMDLFTQVEDVAADGLIGYEIFKRFVVQVDYENLRLTLTVPSAFSYKGPGIAVPFQFNQHIPQVDGDIDGIPGKFDIDTGSRASVDLLQPFVEKHDLKKRYSAKFEAVTGWGVGGPIRSAVVRSNVLHLGKVEVKNLVTKLSLQKKGAFSSPYVAGNVGGGVLKRFNVIFDYPRQQLIFERNKNDQAADLFDRSGMWLNRSPQGFEVIDITALGPAEAAGIKPGDRILAIDGQTADKLSLPEVRERLRSDPPGTKRLLRIQSGEKTREVSLVLKELI